MHGTYQSTWNHVAKEWGANVRGYDAIPTPNFGKRGRSNNTFGTLGWVEGEECWYLKYAQEHLD